MITKWDILNSVVLKECLEVKTDELANLLKRKRVTMTNLRTTTRLIKKIWGKFGCDSRDLCADCLPVG